MRSIYPLPSVARVLLLVLSFAVPVISRAQGGWTPEQELKVRPISAVRVSPDGKKVAFTVSDALMTPDKSEFVTQIWVANSAGGGAVQLTYAEKSSVNPRWSPDGSRLAFTSSRSGKSNLYVLRLIGGEAEQLTDVKSGVGSFAWSPDGTRIAFLLRDAADDEEEKNTKGKDDWRWVDEAVKISRLNVIDLDKDAIGKREPRRLTGDANVNGDFDWSPDGKTIAFTRTKMPKADYWPTADLLAVDVATGQVKTLAATTAAEKIGRAS